MSAGDEPTDRAAASRRFRRTLLAVMSVQLLALAALGWLQWFYTR